MRHAVNPAFAGLPQRIVASDKSVRESTHKPAHEPWEARLSLGFADDRGTTRMVERSHAGPLRVQKPLYPEQPSVCHAVIVHPPGGVVGGDRLEVAVRAGAGAHALLTTPGAGKWYRANGRVSQQQVRLDADAGASIEWLPQETIFFNGADVRLDHAVSLSADAAYLGCEVLCFGRTASGESFDAGRIMQRTTLRRDGRLIWFEQGTLLGNGPGMRSTLGLDRNTVCATLIAAGRPVPPGLLRAIREDMAAIDGGAGRTGATQLKPVFVARYLGHSSESAKRFVAAVWKRLRPHLLGREAVVPRIWNT